MKNHSINMTDSRENYVAPSMEILTFGAEKMVCVSPGNEDLTVDNGEW